MTAERFNFRPPIRLTPRNCTVGPQQSAHPAARHHPTSANAQHPNNQSGPNSATASVRLPSGHWCTVVQPASSAAASASVGIRRQYCVPIPSATIRPLPGHTSNGLPHRIWRRSTDSPMPNWSQTRSTTSGWLPQSSKEWDGPRRTTRMPVRRRRSRGSRPGFQCDRERIASAIAPGTSQHIPDFTLGGIRQAR